MVQFKNRPKGEYKLLPQMKTNDQYYTATQVKQVLDITHGQLYQYVRNGNLHPVTPPGKKQGVYPKREVDELAAKLRAFYSTKQEKLSAFFSPATLKDIPAIADIDERTFNADKKEKAEPKEAYIRWIEEIYCKWLQKNPETFFVLRNTANKTVGFASLVPIKKNTMDRFVRGEIKMGEIPLDDIEMFEPGKPIHLYVVALCIDPIYKGAAKVTYGQQMIEKLFDFLFNLAKRGVEIETITARNEKGKPDGRNLLNKLGFSQLRSQVPDMHVFSVRVADSGYPKLIQYSNILAEWKHAHLIERSKQ